jgi:predicted nucleic acid-binding protein
MVVAFFERNFSEPPITLDAKQFRSVPKTLAALGVTGGPAYDGLIALTALAHQAHLVSIDRRAELTYLRCGVDFELLN